MNKVLILNGPNLGQLGKRETDIYGGRTLEQIKNWTNGQLQNRQIITDWRQTDSETQLIQGVHHANDEHYTGLVINPGAYSHNSLALMDALLSINVPICEVHLSNIYRREAFRQTMLTAKAATMIMCGLGYQVYYFACLGLTEGLQNA